MGVEQAASHASETVTVRSELPAMAEEARVGSAQAAVTVPLLMAQMGLLLVCVLWLVLVSAADQRRGEVAVARLRGRGSRGARACCWVRPCLRSSWGRRSARCSPSGSPPWREGRSSPPTRRSRCRSPLSSRWWLGWCSWSCSRCSRSGASVATLWPTSSAASRRGAWESAGRPRGDARRGCRGGVHRARDRLRAGPGRPARPDAARSGRRGGRGPRPVLSPRRRWAASSPERTAHRGAALLTSSRRGTTRWLVPVVTVALSIIVVSADALAVGARNWAGRAAAEVGAASVLTLNSVDLAAVTEAVRAVDPGGEHLTPVAVVAPGGQAGRRPSLSTRTPSAVSHCGRACRSTPSPGTG